MDDTVNIALRIRDFHMPHEAICTALGVAPEVAWVRGAPRLSSQGERLEGEYPHHALVFVLARAPVGGALPAVEALLNRFEANRALFAALHAEEALCEFFLGYFFRGTTQEVLSPQMMERLSDLEIDLHLDMYGRDPGTDAEWKVDFDRMHTLRRRSCFAPDNWMGITPEGLVIATGPELERVPVDQVEPTDAVVKKWN